jgi:hypothetical protein
LKKLVNDPSKLDELEISMENLYHCLFEAGFFDRLCTSLFKFKDGDENDKFKINKQRFIRSWLHLSSDVQNRDKIMKNLLMVQEYGDQSDTKVLLSILRNDTTSEKLLQKFFRETRIDPKLGLNILKILDTGNIQASYKAAYNLLNSQCTSPQIIAAFISCFKGDISNLKILTDELNLDSQFSEMVYPLALKKPNIDYNLLCQKLGTKEILLIEIISKIACGDISILNRKVERTDIYGESRSMISSEMLELIDAILVLVQGGSDKRRSHKNISLKRILKCSSIISNSILRNLSSGEKPELEKKGDKTEDKKIEMHDNRKRALNDNSSEEEIGTLQKLKPDLDNTYQNPKKEENKYDNSAEDLNSESMTSERHLDKNKDHQTDPPPDSPSEPSSNPLTSLPQIIQTLILFSLGDTNATTELFKTLQSTLSVLLPPVYPHLDFYTQEPPKNSPETPSKFPYNLAEIREFPEKLRKRKKFLKTREVWVKIKNEEGKEEFVRKEVKVKKEDLGDDGIGSLKRMNDYIKVVKNDDLFEVLVYIWYLSPIGVNIASKLFKNNISDTSEKQGAIRREIKNL